MGVSSRRSISLMLIFVLGAILVGCGGGSDRIAQGSSSGCGPLTEPTPVTLGIIPDSQAMTTLVMEQEGFAKKRNLQLNIQEFQNPAALHAASAQHAVDIAFAGLSAAAIARAQGRGIVVFDMLTSTSNAVFALADSPLQNLSDLRGKKLGIFGGRGSATYAITSVVGQEVYGINLSEEAEIIEAPDAAVLGLLDAGRIDAALVGNTATAKAILSGKYKVLSNVVDDYEAKFSSLPPVVSVATNEEFAESNCSVLAAFAGALDESIRYIQASDEVWQNYAHEIMIDDPRAPALMKELFGSKYLVEFDQSQADAATEMLMRLMPTIGEEAFGSEVPEGLFRTDIVPVA